MSVDEWGKAKTLVQPASYAVEWRRPLEGMRKGDYKRKKAEIFVNDKGVTVLRRDSKKDDKRVGFWDFYHIKSWDVSASHFAFKVVSKIPQSFYFETAQARAIADKFKAYVNNIMAERNKARAKGGPGGAAKIKDVFGGDVDSSATLVLRTRKKVVKLKVSFQSNGMLMAPPSSGTSRKARRAAAAAAAAGGGAPAGAPAEDGDSAPADTREEEVEVEETDNMLSDLLGMQEDHVDDLAAAPAAAMPAGDSSLLDLLGGPAPVAAAAPSMMGMQPPVAAMGAMSMGGMAPNPFGGAAQPAYGAPAATAAAAAPNPFGAPMGAPVMQQPMYAAAAAPNPFGGGMPAAQYGAPQQQYGQPAPVAANPNPFAAQPSYGAPMMAAAAPNLFGGAPPTAAPNPFGGAPPAAAPGNPFGDSLF